jgi:hypothetical protein
MLTRKFTFFCVMLGFDLMASIIPGLGEFTLGGIPLLILVSGWKYAGYYFLITEAMALPSLIRTIPTIQPAILLAKNPQIINATINQYVPHLSHSTVSNPFFFPAIIAAVIITGSILTIGMLLGIYKGLRMYIELLRRARAVARSSR